MFRFSGETKSLNQSLANGLTKWTQLELVTICSQTYETFTRQCSKIQLAKVFFYNEPQRDNKCNNSPVFKFQVDSNSNQWRHTWARKGARRTSWTKGGRGEHGGKASSIKVGVVWHTASHHCRDHPSATASMVVLLSGDTKLAVEDDVHACPGTNVLSLCSVGSGVDKWFASSWRRLWYPQSVGARANIGHPVPRSVRVCGHAVSSDMGSVFRPPPYWPLEHNFFSV